MANKTLKQAVWATACMGIVAVFSVISVDAGGDHDKTDELTVDAFCSFFDGVDKKVELASIPDDFGSLTDVQVKIQQLKAYFEEKVDFQTKVTKVRTAAAVTSGADKYILYNEAFYYDLMKKAGTEWGPLGVFAHEIAHHVESHLLPKNYREEGTGGRRNRGQVLIQELEADWFSGRILAKMGATLSDATGAVRNVLPAAATATHPARNARMAIIENGWKSICQNNPSCASEQSYQTDELAVDQFTQDLRGLEPKFTCRLKGQQLLIDNEDKVYWIRAPQYPVGKRAKSAHDACRYELALLGKSHCVSSKNRIVQLGTSSAADDRINRVNSAPYYSDICAPCTKGLCP